MFLHYNSPIILYDTVCIREMMTLSSGTIKNEIVAWVRRIVQYSLDCCSLEIEMHAPLPIFNSYLASLANDMQWLHAIIAWHCSRKIF